MRPERKNSRKTQRGVALVTVLLVFAVATVIAGSTVERTFLNIRRMEQQLVYVQAWQYALAGEAFARQILYTDFAGAQPVNQEDISENGSLLFKMVDKFEQGELEIAIFDLQAKFNLNNLVGGAGEDNKRALEQFSRLMENLSIEPKIIETLLDWIDIDASPPAGNAGDVDYLSQERVYTYSSTNWLITHLSELYLLKDLDRKTVNKMTPYLTALPPPTAVNVNTASAPVLQAMTAGMGPVDAEQVVGARGSEGFTSAEAFVKDDSTAGLDFKTNDVTIKSSYFAVFVKSTFAGRAISLVTVFYRNPQTDKVRLLSRDRSSHFSFDTPARADKAQT